MTDWMSRKTATAKVLENNSQSTFAWPSSMIVKPTTRLTTNSRPTLYVPSLFDLQIFNLPSFTNSETTYQSFISLFRQTGITKIDPEVFGIRRQQFSVESCAILFSIRILYSNFRPITHPLLQLSFVVALPLMSVTSYASSSRGFEVVRVFGHYAIPLTEFIYKAEVC